LTSKKKKKKKKKKTRKQCQKIERRKQTFAAEISKLEKQRGASSKPINLKQDVYQSAMKTIRGINLRSLKEVMNRDGGTHAGAKEKSVKRTR